MTSDWLDDYVRDAVRRNLCTKIGCTTCGAMEFRRGVLLALGRATGRTPAWPPSRDTAFKVIDALAQIAPTETDARVLEPAARCILYDAWCLGPSLHREMEELLVDSWGGQVLRSMQEHYSALERERRARERWDSPAEVQRRREEKRRFKKERHKLRLSAKKGRDRIWYKNHGKDANSEG